MKSKRRILALVQTALFLATCAAAQAEEAPTRALLYKKQEQDGFVYAFLIQEDTKAVLFLNCDMPPEFQSGGPTEVKNYISTRCHDLSNLPREISFKHFFQTKANRFVMSNTENAITLQQGTIPFLASAASMLTINMNDPATATLTYAIVVQPSEENAKIESNRMTFLKISDAVIPYRRLNNETVIAP